MLYLSDAIRGELQTDKFNVIKAPCGSGKSYYALNVLPSKVLGENPPLHKVLYLIDTINGRDGIIQSYPDKARGYDEMIDKNQNFAFVDRYGYIGCCTCWVYRRFYPNIHINSNVKEYLFK